MPTAARASSVLDPGRPTICSDAKLTGESPATFGHLYRLHCRRVYWLCFRMVRNPADAEDLTQQVFLHVFQKMSRFEGRSAFSTWLHRVAVNVVLMHLRRKSLSTASLEEILSLKKGDAPFRISLARTDTRLAGTPDRIVLAKAIARLTGRQRRTLALHAAGYEHREIAARMKCSIACSKANLGRARLRLRDVIQPSAAGRTPRNRSGEKSGQRIRETGETYARRDTEGFVGWEQPR